MTSRLPCLTLSRFATDPHFGAREIAWMAVRDDLVADLDPATGYIVKRTLRALNKPGTL
jgi:hypothetical protein